MLKLILRVIENYHLKNLFGCLFSCFPTALQPLRLLLKILSRQYDFGIKGKANPFGTY